MQSVRSALQHVDQPLGCLFDQPFSTCYQPLSCADQPCSYLSFTYSYLDQPWALCKKITTALISHAEATFHDGSVCPIQGSEA